MLRCQTSHLRYNGSSLGPGQNWSTLFATLRWKNLNQPKGPISLDEYRKAERVIIKMVQTEAFPTEIEALTEKEELSSKSGIAQLFINDNGLMRARGRLSKAVFEFDTKPTILLPSKHHKMQLRLMKDLLDNYHQCVESIRHKLHQ